MSEKCTEVVWQKKVNSNAISNFCSSTDDLLCARVLAKEADKPKVELYMHTWYFLKSLKNDDLIVTGWANGKKGTKIVQQMHQI